MATINLGLTRISHLLALSPTKQTWKAIHIAGTNGKGSVAAYLSSLLRRLGRTRDDDGAKTTGHTNSLRIGRFTSPHLIDRWDCITIDDKPVDRRLFEAVEEQVRITATRVEKQLLEEARRESESKSTTAETTIDAEAASRDAKVTPFELLTATAFEIFSQQKCHLAVIECGLGGRLDATNALKPEDVAICVITRIGLDHQGLLGNTIEEIAREKAGIAKAGIPLVIDKANEESVIAAVREEALKRNAGEVIESRQNLGADGHGLPLHQVQNLSVAMTALATLRDDVTGVRSEPSNERDKHPFDVGREDNEIIANTLLDAEKSYPGRLQKLRSGWATSLDGLEVFKTSALLDGAHNVQSAKVLRDYIESTTMKEQPTRGVFWILAMSQGKALKGILEILIKSEDRVIFCEFGTVDGMPWVRPTATKDLTEATVQIGLGSSVRGEARNIYDALRLLSGISQIPDQDGDVKTVVNEQDGNGVQGRSVVIAGSLYLVSDLHRLLRDGATGFEKHWCAMAKQ